MVGKHAFGMFLMVCSAARFVHSQGAVRNISESDFVPISRRVPDVSVEVDQEPSGPDDRDAPIFPEEDNLLPNEMPSIAEDGKPSATRRPYVPKQSGWDILQSAEDGKKPPPHRFPFQQPSLVDALKKFGGRVLPARYLTLARTNFTQEEVVQVGGRKYLRYTEILKGPAGMVYLEFISPARNKRSNPDAQIHSG